MNSWRAKVIAEIDDTCQMCMLDIPKTITCRFWDYRMACKAWDFSVGIINTIKSRPGQKGVVEINGISGKKIPTSIGKYSRNLLLLRGITLWAIWVERNDRIFNNNRRDAKNTHQMI